MTKRVQLAKAEVKDRLADKYIRLARVAGSRPKRQTYLFHANFYRRQAEVLRREAGQ